MEEFSKELVEIIKKKKIRTVDELEKEKLLLVKKHGIKELPRNADIMRYVGKDVKNIFKTKPVRTLSGVSNIAVMWISDITCPGSCIYCPSGKNSPKSYTGCEPATLRAERNRFDPYRQVKNRLHQLKKIGHDTNKSELIIMGGTFMSAPKKFQEDFIRKCFNAFNNKKSGTLKQAQKLNENAKNRVIGLTIETRADFCKKEHINQMLKLGCTRVEIGVQSTSDRILKKIQRGHGTAENKKTLQLLKDSGLKTTAHWMAGLSGLGKLGIESEKKDYDKLFKDQWYRPDELKIYPLLVISGTKIFEMCKKGEYIPLNVKNSIRIIKHIKSNVPEYVRIKRIMRDISHKKVVAGPAVTNLRQLVQESGTKCRCIRCREIRTAKTTDPRFTVKKYNSSGGKEFFLSYEEKGKIIGFLRLRLPYKPFRPEINKKTALVRELHVYGPIAKFGVKGKNIQHRGFGALLLKQAEKIAQEKGSEKISVTSGVGARKYYKRLGYQLNGPYMQKKLDI